MGATIIGVLALQGAFAKHIQMMESLGVKAIEVRKPHELSECDALIIPGGESTTMMKQMRFIDFPDAFRSFARSKPVFGTCAGLILMSDEIVADTMEPFHLLDIAVERNAFGRQIESFEAQIDFSPNKDPDKGKPHKLQAIFIRAPRIVKTGSQVQTLAAYEGEPVLVQQGCHLGATFHPELSHDQTVHAHFLRMVKTKMAQ